MAKSLEELDSKFWKTLKKNAGIKSSGFFKKADASVGKHIEALNKAREKFEFTQLTEDLFSYQKALDKLADTFDKFVSAKHLDEIEENDLKKKEKDELVLEIKKWSGQIATAKEDLDKKLKKFVASLGDKLDKFDSLEGPKKKVVWDKIGISDTFNL